MKTVKKIILIIIMLIVSIIVMQKVSNAWNLNGYGQVSVGLKDFRILLF